MIRDRGIMKWSAFKLPEHELLIQNDIEVPYNPTYSFTDWEIEDLQHVIYDAAAQGKIITLTVKNQSNYNELIGTIKSINNDRMFLNLETATGTRRVLFSSLYKAYMEE